MAKGFVVNAHRFDPYKNFKFQLMWTDRKSPGRSSYEAITLERGITHDPEFERWANLVHPIDDAGMDLKNFRKDLVLLMNNERGLTVKRYKLFRCWVSEYQAVPDLDANANAIAIETMKLELEGWVRDEDTPEPDENG
jgi:phage tail-like protein